MIWWLPTPLFQGIVSVMVCLFFSKNKWFRSYEGFYFGDLRCQILLYLEFGYFKITYPPIFDSCDSKYVKTFTEPFAI